MRIFFLKVPSLKVLLSAYFPFIRVKVLFIGVLFMLLAGLTESLAAEAGFEPTAMDITFQDDLISAKLVDAPLIEVLQRIEQEFGYIAHFHGDLSEPITLSFTDLPLDKCLRLLTANHSLSVATRQSSDQDGQSARKQIAEIWVLSRSKTSKIANNPTVTPAILPPVVLEEQPENQGQESLPTEQVSTDLDVEISAQRQEIQNLAATGDPASIMAMAEMLSSEDKDIRQLLVDGIGSVQSDESTQVLGQVLQNESDPEIRRKAVLALGKRKDDAAAQAFLEAARNDSDNEIKILADKLLAE